MNMVTMKPLEVSCIVTPLERDVIERGRFASLQ
jgi:hypothetical protein